MTTRDTSEEKKKQERRRQRAGREGIIAVIFARLLAGRTHMGDSDEATLLSTHPEPPLGGFQFADGD